MWEILREMAVMVNELEDDLQELKEKIASE